MFLGQPKLLELLNTLNISNFPKTSLVLGDFGCGKSLFISLIQNKLNLNTQQLSDIDTDLINNINLNPTPTIYIIDGNNLTQKQQNILLKLMEEPLENSYLILKCEDLGSLLDTIVNRCFIFKFSSYDKATLNQFIPDKYKNIPDICTICNTPGKLVELENLDFMKHYEFGLKIVTKLNTASLANTLTIADKINYKDEYDKLNLNLLLTMVLHHAYNYYIKNNLNMYLKLYQLTLKYIQQFKNKIFDKKQLMLSYLIHSWQIVR